jgi:hypothetical protein
MGGKRVVGAQDEISPKLLDIDVKMIYCLSDVCAGPSILLKTTRKRRRLI